MKILCLGRWGNSRSITLAYLLKVRGHEAIAVGMRCMGKDTRKMMLDWADLIILLHEKCGEGVPKEHWPKMKMWEAGGAEAPDVFYGRLDPELKKLLETYIKRENL